ncbi:uncharacterized protein LOC121729960 [Aricia agestis]|uniref:uncharacterized protein LOC121729960 n=1 Tax=Aricia agestis TaxID=91739 RepID=UPI001C20A6C7|nr:uncharacterized protein LOC121729960 [Aricia agestis]
MLNPHKNSYLQLVSVISPRVINKAVDMAMKKENLTQYTDGALPLESAQPSIFPGDADLTRSKLGYGRLGLTLLVRELHSPDHVEQMQAINTLFDQMQISEHAMFFINMNVVYRLTDLMSHPHPSIREKVCLVLNSIANYREGRQKIMLRPKIVENLLLMILKDKRELRYAAAVTLNTLSRDRCCIEPLLKNENTIENLLRSVTYDHTIILETHLKTLESLIGWDQVAPLKFNAFQIMLELIKTDEPKIISGALDCMSQLCKHDVGRKLADEYDMTYTLLSYLKSEHSEVVISALGLMQYTTLTTRSKWRAKEFCGTITKELMTFAASRNPILQLRSLQILINLCDIPDIRLHMRKHWVVNVKNIRIPTPEEWNGTSQTDDPGLDTGHYYRTVFIDGAETIRNDSDEKTLINVHSYLNQLCSLKKRLLEGINWQAHKD